MNARRRHRPTSLPARVYAKGASWYWHVPHTTQWIRLCKMAQGEARMLERLATEKRKREGRARVGNTGPLIDQYVAVKRHAHQEKAWPSYGRYARNALRNLNVEQIDAPIVAQMLRYWKEKLSMQRVMRAFLSGFFQWCIEEGHAKMNPCRELKLKKPKARAVYITDEHFAQIRAHMLRDAKSAQVPTGPMMQCFVDLCYLTAQRSTDIRALRWSQIDRAAGVIHFLPSKTEDSSGAGVDFTLTPEIEAVLDRVRKIDARPRIGDLPVIHARNGKPYEATAVRSAWNRAVERAQLSEYGYTVKDIRAKALTDAERAGYDIKALMITAAHTNERTTQIYLKQRDMPISHVRLKVPKSA